jgi:hypothetical protein
VDNVRLSVIYTSIVHTCNLSICVNKPLIGNIEILKNTLTFEIYPYLRVHLPDSDVISLILKADLPEYLYNRLTGLCMLMTVCVGMRMTVCVGRHGYVLVMGL